MTATDLLQCTSPEDLLKHLADRASDRKLRLYAVACCQRIWPLLTDKRSRRAVEVAERFADDRATLVELAAARSAAVESAAGVVTEGVGDVLGYGAQAQKAAAGAAWASTHTSGRHAAWDAHQEARFAVRDGFPRGDYEAERIHQAVLLHDLCGNVLRDAAVDRSCLGWADGTVVKIAATIYAERRFADLVILADALEDAGCTDMDLLDHCRLPGPHVRGCWLLDLLLGKE
jgi:hypothetical protein